MATNVRESHRTRSRRAASNSSAFTLVELLISTIIVAGIAFMLTSVVGQTSSIWKRSTGQIEQFRNARNAFDAMTTRLSQATLNTYWDYNSATLPTAYERRSELRFIAGPVSQYLGNGSSGTRVTHCVFFHAPLGVVDATASNAGYRGLENLLNVWGYYVELNSDAPTRPAFLSQLPKAPPEKYRFRLMEFRQSSEQVATYLYTSGLDPGGSGKAAAVGYQGTDWYQPSANGASPPQRVVAENIVALIITPRLSKEDELALPPSLASSNSDFSPLAPNYAYDSSQTSNPGQSITSPLINPKSQLPPILQVTMVAIDEASALRLNLAAASADIFNISNKFSSTAQYSTDLTINSGADGANSLEGTLVAKKLNYRIFSTNLPIHAAKWSRDETK